MKFEAPVQKAVTAARQLMCEVADARLSKSKIKVIATQDRMINPDLERYVAKRTQSQVIETSGQPRDLSFAPQEVVALIEKAATAGK